MLVLFLGLNSTWAAAQQATAMPYRQDAPGYSVDDFGIEYAHAYAKEYKSEMVGNMNIAYTDFGIKGHVYPEQVSSQGSLIKRGNKQFVFIESYFEAPGEIKRHRNSYMVMRLMKGQLRAVKCVSGKLGVDVTLSTNRCWQLLETELGLR